MRRSLVLVAAFGLAFWATTRAGGRALDRADAPRGRTVLEYIEGVHRSLLLVEQRSRGEEDVVVVGDSHLARVGRQPPVHVWFERALWAERPQAAVWRVATPGLNVFAHYALVDRIAAAQPDRVVLEVNLADFSEAWRESDLAPLAGWIPPSRWLEAAALLLQRGGLSLDRLLFDRALFGAGADSTWKWLQGQQARVALGYWTVADALQARSPWPEGMAYTKALQRAELERWRTPGRRRASAVWARAVLAPALAGAPADHAALRFLEAILSAYREAGIPVLVFVHPVNVDHLRALGFDTEGLQRTVARVEAVAVWQGAAFVDLHALLPDPAFRDEMDHLESGPPHHAMRQLGEALAEALLAPPP